MTAGEHEASFLLQSLVFLSLQSAASLSTLPKASATESKAETTRRHNPGLYIVISAQGASQILIFLPRNHFGCKNKISAAACDKTDKDDQIRARRENLGPFSKHGENIDGSENSHSPSLRELAATNRVCLLFHWERGNPASNSLLAKAPVPITAEEKERGGE